MTIQGEPGQPVVTDTATGTITIPTCGSLSEQQIFVSNTSGTDDPTCGTFLCPCHTIAYAETIIAGLPVPNPVNYISLMDGSSVPAPFLIHLDAGTYTSTFTMDCGIYVSGLSNLVTKISTGSNVTLSSNWGKSGCFGGMQSLELDDAVSIRFDLVNSPDGIFELDDVTWTEEVQLKVEYLYPLFYVIGNQTNLNPTTTKLGPNYFNMWNSQINKLVAKLPSPLPTPPEVYALGVIIGVTASMEAVTMSGSGTLFVGPSEPFALVPSILQMDNCASEGGLIATALAYHTIIELQGTSFGGKAIFSGPQIKVSADVIGFNGNSAIWTAGASVDSNFQYLTFSDTLGHKPSNASQQSFNFNPFGNPGGNVQRALDRLVSAVCAGPNCSADYTLNSGFTGAFWFQDSPDRICNSINTTVAGLTQIRTDLCKVFNESQYCSSFSNNTYDQWGRLMHCGNQTTGSAPDGTLQAGAYIGFDTSNANITIVNNLGIHCESDGETNVSDSCILWKGVMNRMSISLDASTGTFTVDTLLHAGTCMAERVQSGETFLDNSGLCTLNGESGDVNITNTDKNLQITPFGQTLDIILNPAGINSSNCNCNTTTTKEIKSPDGGSVCFDQPPVQCSPPSPIQLEPRGDSNGGDPSGGTDGGGIIPIIIVPPIVPIVVIIGGGGGPPSSPGGGDPGGGTDPLLNPPPQGFPVVAYNTTDIGTPCGQNGQSQIWYSIPLGTDMICGNNSLWYPVALECPVVDSCNNNSLVIDNVPWQIGVTKTVVGGVNHDLLFLPNITENGYSPGACIDVLWDGRAIWNFSRCYLPVQNILFTQANGSILVLHNNLTLNCQNGVECVVSQYIDPITNFTNSVLNISLNNPFTVESLDANIIVMTNSNGTYFVGLNGAFFPNGSNVTGIGITSIICEGPNLICPQNGTAVYVYLTGFVNGTFTGTTYFNGTIVVNGVAYTGMVPSYSVNGGTQFQGQNLDFRASGNLAVSYSAGKVTYVDSVNPVYLTVSVPSFGGFYGGTVEPDVALVSVQITSTPGSCVPGGLYYHSGIEREMVCQNDAVTLLALGYLTGIKYTSTFFSSGIVSFDSPLGTILIVADSPSQTLRLDVNPSLTGLTTAVVSTRLGVPWGGSPPGTCTVGDVWMNTGTESMDLCVSPNTWVASAPVPLASSGTLSYAPSGAASLTLSLLTYLERPSINSLFATCMVKLPSSLTTTGTGSAQWTAPIPAGFVPAFTQQSASYIVVTGSISFQIQVTSTSIIISLTSLAGAGTWTGILPATFTYFL